MGSFGWWNYFSLSYKHLSITETGLVFYVVRIRLEFGLGNTSAQTISWVFKGTDNKVRVLYEIGRSGCQNLMGPISIARGQQNIQEYGQT